MKKDREKKLAELRKQLSKVLGTKGKDVDRELAKKSVGLSAGGGSGFLKSLLGKMRKKSPVKRTLKLTQTY